MTDNHTEAGIPPGDLLSSPGGIPVCSIHNRMPVLLPLGLAPDRINPKYSAGDLLGNAIPDVQYCPAAPEQIGMFCRIGFRQQEMTHIVENIFYNELIVRRCSVDIGTVCTPERNTSGNPAQTPREIDFIASKGGKKVYIQSACAMETEEKIAAENKPLSLTGDSFPGIIVRHDMRKRRYDESGVLNIDIIDFLPDNRLFQNTMAQFIPGIGDKKKIVPSYVFGSACLQNGYPKKSRCKNRI